MKSTIGSGSVQPGSLKKKTSSAGTRQSPKSDSMRSHQRGSRRVWFIITLLIGLGACLSCGSDRQTDSFLERHSQELVNWTVPIDSSSLVRGSVQRTTWGETASWEFDTKMSGAEYTEWATGKLRNRFRIASRTDSQLSFS